MYDKDCIDDSDIRYYERRVVEERARAQQAKEPAARAAHRMLSEIYLERLDSLKIGSAASGRTPDPTMSPLATPAERVRRLT